MSAPHSDLRIDSPEGLRADCELAVCRRLRRDTEDAGYAFMLLPSSAEHPLLEGARRLTHEHDLKDPLDCAWALRPVELARVHGQTMLFVEFSGGMPLDRLIGEPMEIGRF